MSYVSKGPRVWAISDFHWSTHKPMDRHGGVWSNHRQRLIDEWRARVHLHDLVLVPGDLTFARDPHDDLLELHRLPGQKVLLPGNHDYWCRGRSRPELNRILQQYPTLHMLSHYHLTYETGPHLIVGYTGAEPPETPLHKPALHEAAVADCKAALNDALAVVAQGQTVIVLTHYPPSELERRIMEPLRPALWLHGHCHLAGVDRPYVADWQKTRRDPAQLCISSDFLDMRPIQVTGGVVHPHI